MKRIVMLIALFLTSCTHNVKSDLMDKQTKFKWQACLVVYCTDTENSKVKKAGLKIVEIAAASQGVKLELNRGICTGYYEKRLPGNEYIWAKKSAEQVCHEK